MKTKLENFFISFFSSEKSDTAINTLIKIIAAFIILTILIIITK